jgi:Ca2+-transporting ATPase
MTSFFALFIFSGVFGALCARSNGRNVFKGLSKNRTFTAIFTVIALVSLLLIYYGGAMFRTSPIPPAQLFEVVLLGFTVVPFEIIRKTVFKSRKKR